MASRVESLNKGLMDRSCSGLALASLMILNMSETSQGFVSDYPNLAFRLTQGFFGVNQTLSHRAQNFNESVKPWSFCIMEPTPESPTTHLHIKQHKAVIKL